MRGERSTRGSDAGPYRRRLPVGAEAQPGRGVHFRVWAPEARAVQICFEGPHLEPMQLEGEPGGYHSAFHAGAGAGTLYRLRLDGGDPLPDPASRFQPQGPRGPSEVIDPAGFDWGRDSGWKGIALRGQVLYEMHVGTFSAEGTWKGALPRLAHLAATGVTAIELMPIYDFPGRFGWGYDGVCLFAPTRLYGRPDELRGFVAAAHELGLGVILDVVYNHLGPDANFLPRFAPAYFREDRATDWGAAIDFDGESSGPVRELYLANAGYWIEEFRFDGLRLDATQDIHDSSPEHILSAISRRVRNAAGERGAIVIAENEPQEARLVRPESSGGYGMDGLWNDDFHHSAMVALTGRREAYYTDYLGSSQELLSALKWGFLYQGQRYQWQQKRRGSPALDLPPWCFVNYVQNHDQIANSKAGLRLHQLGSPGRFRALTALLLLGPGTPMLFQGQEFSASSPFLYFADHGPEIASSVEQGRREFLKQFPSLALDEVQAQLNEAVAEETFLRCKLDWTELEEHREALELHRDLLRLRREDPTIGSARKGGIDGAVLGSEAFVVRFFGSQGEDRLLVANLGRELELKPAPEPLLAPPAAQVWSLLWSSEDVRYGGGGMPPPENDGEWRIPAESAVLLAPAPPKRGSPS